MTQKFIGPITIDTANGIKVEMPSDTAIPPKQEWSKHPIWQCNGKAYMPLTKLAENQLADAIKTIESCGYTKATKEAKWKPTSIRYAILTTGVENFTYIK